MNDDDRAGEFGPIYLPALQRIRDLWLELEPLVDQTAYDDVVAPTELQISLSDGLSDAESARLDIQWSELGMYSFHIGGVNVSELARVGLVEMLRQALDEQDEIAVYERYSRGEIGGDVARVLLGEKLDRMKEEKDSFETAMERDSSEFLAGSDAE